MTLNIDHYLQHQADFPVDDDFREKLLKYDIGSAQRIKIVEAMDLSLLPALAARAGVIGPILHESCKDISELGAEICTALIVNSKPIDIQIALLNRAESRLNETEVRQTLSALPAPYSKIRVGWEIPRLPATDSNIDLVKWLDRRKFISSWSQGGFFDNDIRVNLRRK